MRFAAQNEHLLQCFHFNAFVCENDGDDQMTFQSLQADAIFIAFYCKKNRYLTFNPSCANCSKSRLLFLSAEMIKKLLWQTVCSGSRLFASILNSSVMLGNYLQQTTFSDAFFLGTLRVKQHF